MPRGEGNHGTLDVEAEQHHVAVLDDIILSFRAQLAGVSRGSLAAERDVIVVSDRLGADEAALEIGMDGAGGLGRLGAFLHRPGARFLRAGGEEGDQVEQVALFWAFSRVLLLALFLAISPTLLPLAPPFIYFLLLLPLPPPIFKILPDNFLSFPLSPAHLFAPWVCLFGIHTMCIYIIYIHFAREGYPLPSPLGQKCTSFSFCFYYIYS